jgi:hypothetical protein
MFMDEGRIVEQGTPEEFLAILKTTELSCSCPRFWHTENAIEHAIRPSR